MAQLDGLDSVLQRHGVGLGSVMLLVRRSRHLLPCHWFEGNSVSVNVCMVCMASDQQGIYVWAVAPFIIFSIFLEEHSVCTIWHEYFLVRGCWYKSEAEHRAEGVSCIARQGAHANVPMNAHTLCFASGIVYEHERIKRK